MKTCATVEQQMGPDNDPGTVEDKEHDDGDSQDDGQVAVSLLLLQPTPCCLRA